MSNGFIILAAGKSKRFNSKVPKPYVNYKGKMLISHSIAKAIAAKKFKHIVIAVNKAHKKFYSKIDLKDHIKIISGGNSRAYSAKNCLKFLKNKNIKKVLIHDGARPDFSNKLINKILKNLKDSDGVIPVLKISSAVKFKSGNKIKNVDRDKMFLAQTPQGFNFKSIYDVQNLVDNKTTDDSHLMIKKNKKIKFIAGEEMNKKITKKSDLKFNKEVFYGIGFDVHRLVPARNLYLGGLKIKSKLGTLGHSDGDPVLHAITDSILGACKMGDIGNMFSDKNKKYKNIRSTILLEQVIKKIMLKQYYVNNLDINIITETPKISKYKEGIIKSISNICKISKNKINVKGKTAEKLGVIGKQKAIACEVITSIIKYE